MLKRFLGPFKINWCIFLVVSTSSVASIWVLGVGGGGGGVGVGPPHVPTGKSNHAHVTYMRERAPQKHIFSGLKIHLHTYSLNNQCSSRLLLMVYGAINDGTLTKH